MLNFKIQVDPLNIKIIQKYFASLILKYSGMFKLIIGTRPFSEIRGFDAPYYI